MRATGGSGGRVTSDAIAGESISTGSKATGSSSQHRYSDVNPLIMGTDTDVASV